LILITMRSSSGLMAMAIVVAPSSLITCELGVQTIYHSRLASANA
jgi:hypothetical protein